MTRKDFQLIAELIADLANVAPDEFESVELTARDFAKLASDKLAEEYPRFNKTKFCAAVSNAVESVLEDTK